MGCVLVFDISCWPGRLSLCPAMVGLVPGVLGPSVGMWGSLPSCVLVPMRLPVSWESSTPAPCSCWCHFGGHWLALWEGTPPQTSPQLPPRPPVSPCPGLPAWRCHPGCRPSWACFRRCCHSSWNLSAFPLQIPRGFCPLKNQVVFQHHHKLLRMTYLLCHLRLCVGKQGLSTSRDHV